MYEGQNAKIGIGMGTPQQPKRTVAGDEVLDALVTVVERYARLDVLIEKRLAPVVLAVPPGQDETVCKADRDFPPYFAEIRTQVNRLHGIAKRIEATINRVELPE